MGPSRPAHALSTAGLRHVCFRGRHAAALTAALLSYSTVGVACTSASAGGSYADTVTVQAIDADAPSTQLLRNWTLLTGRGQNHYVIGCALTERVAIAARGETTLRPVTTVPHGGYWYTGYELTPSSPLLIFRLVTNIGGVPGGGSFVPVIDIASILHPGESPPPGNVSTARGAYLEYAVVGRGTTVTSVSERLAVMFTTTPHNYPGLSIPSGLRIAINVMQPTCRLSQASFQLPDILATELPVPGPATRSERFTVGLHCDGNGRSLRLTMRDALDPGNIGSELSPAPDSTVQGVLLQVLRDDRPIFMNSSWVTSSIKGDHALALAARYYRKTGPFRSGVVGARATLTLDYN